MELCLSRKSVHLFRLVNLPYSLFEATHALAFSIQNLPRSLLPFVTTKTLLTDSIPLPHFDARPLCFKVRASCQRRIGFLPARCTIRLKASASMPCA